MRAVVGNIKRISNIPTNCAPNRCWLTAGKPICSTLRRTSTWEGDRTRCCDGVGHRMSEMRRGVEREV